MNKRRYDVLVFDWNGTLSTAHLPLSHYSETSSVPRLYPGVKASLQALHQQGYIMAIASAASTNKLLFETAHHEIDGYFSYIQGGEGVYRKPDPELLNHIMAKLGTEPERCVMIGDTESDMEMAQAANMARIAVTYGIGAKEQLLSYKPIGTINTITDLVVCLNSLNHL